MIAVPVPLVIPLYAQVPATRIFMLAGISLLTMFVETTRGAVVPLAFLFFLQALLGSGVLWLVAYGVSRALARVSDGARALCTVGIIALILAAATTGSFYLDPFRPEILRPNLMKVYE